MTAKLGETRASVSGNLVRLSPEDAEKLKLYPKLVETLQHVMKAYRNYVHGGALGNVAWKEALDMLAECENLGMK